MTKLDKLTISAIRATCIDTINKAKSGHPGMALGSAPILYALYKNHLVANPKNPLWINRDRLIFSAGHASALLYTMLHLSGYLVTIDDLKEFRQLDSMTPGHPEYRMTFGVDATAGPLGQGIAQAVGIAMAEKATAAQYSFGKELINHYTYCLCGDGCLEEGISQEAISFAGLHKLNKLILFYDSNNITLDGELSMSNIENEKLRFESCNWNVLEIEDGNNYDAINDAINKAKNSADKPTLIIVKTIIGFGSQKQGTSKVHGNPLGDEDGLLAKQSYGYDYPPFEIPEEVYENFKNTFEKRGYEAEKQWNETLHKVLVDNKDEASLFLDAFDAKIEKYLQEVPSFEENNNDSTRTASGKILNSLHEKCPFIMGGSADVAGSVMTKILNGSNFTPENPKGKNINFGIREFAMASIQNGMLLHGGLKTYVGSFFVFSDYFKSAIRTASLSKLPAIYLLSHDSIAVGEDGPTHQPIEHLTMLRSMPNINVIRPCDSKETYAAWMEALKSEKTPTAIILSRQNLPLISNSKNDISMGGYIIKRELHKLVKTIIATGSEVSLAIEVANNLESEGYGIRVVSMPCVEMFEKADSSYKQDVIGTNRDNVIAIEMGSTMCWYKYAGTVFGIDSFGKSGPASKVLKAFGFDIESMTNKVRNTLK